MQKFDKSAAWDDAKRLLGAHQNYVWTIAGVFIFLPQLLFGLLMPAPNALQQTALTPEAQIETLRGLMLTLLPFALLMAVVSSIGSAAILRIWLARSEITVGDAVKTGLGLVITLFIIHILTSISVGIGLFLLIIPGIYLWVRLLVAPAFAVDMNERNPIAALAASWRLTKGNSLSIFIFVILLVIVASIIFILLSTIAALFGLIPAVGLFLVQAISGFLATVATIFFLAVVAAIYRQLVVINGATMVTGQPEY